MEEGDCMPAVMTVAHVEGPFIQGVLPQGYAGLKVIFDKSKSNFIAGVEA
jgi:hypothetical protein